MGIIQTIKRWWNSLWQKEAQDKFGVETIRSDDMETALNEWVEIYQGNPKWARPDKKGNVDIESFNFAKKLCNETARLTTLALGITVEGSARADWINGFMESYIARMKNEECEKACAFGYIILKPNGKGIDYVMPWDFCPTHQTDWKVDGGIFFDHYHEPGDKWYYTRLEWQRFEEWRVPMRDDVMLYRITNKTYKATGTNGIGQECSMSETVWANLQEDAAYQNIEQPLFSIFKMPIANNIDLESPLGVSMFSNAIRELEGVDIAWTRLDDETYDSQHITFMGDSLIEEPGKPVKKRYSSGGIVDKIGRALPRRVRILPGSTTGEEYHEETPTLQMSERIVGINHRLDMVGTKCGYSPGYFVLNGRGEYVNVKQVEASDRETIESIKQLRDSLQTATDGLIYALDKYADIYSLAPVGTYKVNYDFMDITYDWETDRERHWMYVQAGKYPLWMYYVKFEGMSEEEAKAVAAEAKSENEQNSSLFGEE